MAASKLKNLRIKKVDFVDEGANPDAHIGMIKRKTVEGQAGAESGEKGSGSILKKLLGFIGKAAGMGQEEIDSAMDEIQKGTSVSFNEKFNETKNRKIADEIWDICYALQSSLCSILNDEELDSASMGAAMQESLDEFHAVVGESITQWSGGKEASIVMKNEEVSDADLELMKSAVERLNKSIAKAEKPSDDEGEDDEDGAEKKEGPKGDEEEMKIDKSKLTDAERAFLDSIEKRYGMEDGQTEGGTQETDAPQEQTSGTEPPVIKSVTQPGENIPDPAQQTDGDIYKGMHPAVKAELEELKKFREAAEERELGLVAEKYAIIGKKKEELVPMLKSLKAAGGSAYDDMIAILDQAVDTVEKSGAFTEIGKSGHGGDENSAEAKISGIAKGYMEKDASLDYQAAVAKAWENNPDLLAEYDEQAGF